MKIDNETTSKMYSKVRAIFKGHNIPDPHTAVVADLVYGILDLVPTPKQDVRLWVSPEQVYAHKDLPPEHPEAGRYLPCRRTPGGKFTMPLYEAPRIDYSRVQQFSNDNRLDYNQLCAAVRFIMEIPQ